MKLRRTTLAILILAVVIPVSLPPLISAGEKRILFWTYRTKSAPIIASRITLQPQRRVQEADEAALRGSMAIADGRYAVAVEELEDALTKLPDASLTRERRAAYSQQLITAYRKLNEQWKADLSRLESSIR